MPTAHINTETELERFCDELTEVPVIAFDTEFVTENTYRPELCLIQVATERGSAIIDPLAVGNVSAFWKTLATPALTTVVHAGRTDIEFCLYATGSLPSRLVDVQLASGFVGLEYPSGYSSLVYKLLGQSLSKHETRTDWRRRPLSQRQLEYAVDDVRYLGGIWETLESRLVELGRLEWFEDEMTRWTAGIRDALQRESWQRVSGNSGLDGRSLAVLREIWRWRQEEAVRSNKPPRRILRDDLMVELAKRKSADPKRILALRGMEWRVHKRWIPDIVSAVERALALPKSDLPRVTPARKGPSSGRLGPIPLFRAGERLPRTETRPVLSRRPERHPRVDCLAKRHRRPHLQAAPGRRLARRNRRQPVRRTPLRQSLRPHRQPHLRQPAHLRPHQEVEVGRILFVASFLLYYSQTGSINLLQKKSIESSKAPGIR